MLNHRLAAWRTRITAFALLLLVLAGISDLLAEMPDIQLTQVSSQFNIVDIANAGDGSGRLFLAERTGRIFILDSQGETLQTPFLDMRSRVTAMGLEQGLLSLAFAPDFETSGYFYVWYTTIGGGTALARYRVSEEPNLADPDSHQMVLFVAQPFDNHNGGRLQFGPDGMLYLGLGDGGGSFDPDNAGQDGQTLLGKLIRIDVNPVHGTYAVPADNPFVGNSNVLNEIWATGLRNPWRISFDRATGDLFIADVGQNQWEEINFQPASSTGGENYGWDIMEASSCVGGGTGCNRSGKVLPVAEYNHDVGCSVTGGEVYRGQAYPRMVGMYFFGDYCTGRLWGLVQDNGQWTMTELLDTTYRFTTFGLGEDGSLYAVQPAGIYLVSDGEPQSEDPFSINLGFSDAWFNPLTDGQGFFVIVWEEIQTMFVGWFTYDTMRPPEDYMAILGEPGHRWITAQGTYQGATATLVAYERAGGVFDSEEPPAGDAVPIGTMTITWTDCNTGVASYDFPDLGLVDSVPIQRIVLDNVAVCEALQGD